MSENIIKVRSKQKRDTEVNWINNNPVLLEGELCFSSDKNDAFKIGDGISKWSELEYKTNYNMIIDSELSEISENPVQNKVVDAKFKEINKSVKELQVTTLTGTLTVGETTITLTDASITTDSTIDIYTDVYGVNPKNVSVEDGSLTLEFSAQERDVQIKVVVN